MQLKLRLGLVQYAPEWESPRENMSILKRFLEKAGNGYDILIFPEMALTGFTMKSDVFAEIREGESARYFSSIARKYNTHVIAGMIERDGDRFFNASIHFRNDGSIAACYRKVHLFPLAGENKYYAVGCEPGVSRAGETKIGLSICYDLRFPELYRIYAKSRIPLMVNIANWPEVRKEHWISLLQARAIENQCFMAGVNRTGIDPALAYKGNSAVFDPLGRQVVCAGDEEDVITAEIDLSIVNEIRTCMPFLDDMKLFRDQ